MPCYHAPTDLDEALGLLGAGASVIAGGTDWYPARGRRLPEEDVLDITRIAALRGVEVGEGWSRIGAAATWAEVASADLPPAFDGLRAAARVVGGVQIQNAGTVVGNLCNASPAADGAPPLLTLDTGVEIASVEGTRRMPLSEFLIGPRKTALGRGEIVTALHVPPQPEGARGAFEKAGARAYLVISIAMTAMVVRVTGGLIDHARVAVGSCGPTALRLEALERDMIGARPSEVRVEPSHLAPLSPIDDVRADAAYRAEAVPVQVARMLERLYG